MRHAIDNYNNTEVLGKVLKVKKARARKKYDLTKPVWEQT